MLFGVGVSCRILYSIVSYLYVNCSGSVTSVGKERAYLSAIVYMKLCGFCSKRFPLPLGAWYRLRYFIVALPGLSISLYCIFHSKMPLCCLSQFIANLNFICLSTENARKTKRKHTLTQFQMNILL